MSRVLCAISVLKLVAEKSFRKASILSAGPGRERPGIEKSTVFNQNPFRKRIDFERWDQMGVNLPNKNIIKLQIFHSKSITDRFSKRI